MENCPVSVDITPHKKKSSVKKSSRKKTEAMHSSVKLTGLSDNYVTYILDMIGVTKSEKQRKISEKEIELSEASPPVHPQFNVDPLVENHLQQAQDMLAHEYKQLGHYKWMWEGHTPNTFQEFGPSEREVEIAYSMYNKNSETLKEGKFTQVNFITMTAIRDNVEKGIIRTEHFEALPNKVIFPSEWTEMSKNKNTKLKIEELESDMEEFKLLDVCLNEHNLRPMKISRVQSTTLYTRFLHKCSQMKCQDCAYLWHRPSNICIELIARYGFHPRFSGMQEAKHLGEGVLFYKDPRKWLPSNPGETINLIYSKVLIGSPGSGKKGLRWPLFNDIIGEPFDSAQEDGAYMIFSDAQAYPEYVVTLKTQ